MALNCLLSISSKKKKATTRIRSKLLLRIEQMELSDFKHDRLKHATVTQLHKLQNNLQ